MKRVAIAVVAVVLAVGSPDAAVRRADRTSIRQTAADHSSVRPAYGQTSGLSLGLARTLDPVINAVWSAYDTAAARDHVKFVSQYWRLAGNTGYDAALDRVYARLSRTSKVFSPRRPAASDEKTSEVFFEQYPNTGHGWEHSVGTLALVHSGRKDEVLLSK